MKLKATIVIITATLFLSNALFGQSNSHQKSRSVMHSYNPLLPGDFADPCIVQYKDTFYIYATAWDSKDAIVWYSANFIDWKMRKLNWPTTKLGEVIWAPCVVKGKDGRFYFYTATGHNIYVGASNHPMGPFKNLLPNEQPLVKNHQFWNAMHSIDADCFIDDDGQAYLYYGSGFDWKNGICAVGRLNADMCSFKEDPKLITPPNYFEAPHMMKRNGTYFLMYSDGICVEDSYKVRYSTSKSPMGPFIEGENSPILTNTPDSLSWSSGHHYTIHLGNKDYIAYHKQAIPIYSPFWGPIRQVSFDEMKVNKNGKIEKVIPTREGVVPTFSKNKIYIEPLPVKKATASAQISNSYSAEKAFDNHNGTLWAAPTGKPEWIKADLGSIQNIKFVVPIFDIIDGDYEYQIEYSSDNKNWKEFANFRNNEANEWPHTSFKSVKARYVKLTINKQTKEPKRIGLWELKIYSK
jgi:beta-xylosidase